ncbi:MAG: hypothetical protein ABI717_00155 [Actinomycetota bacterium]
MPHWNGVVDTASPPALARCNGDPVCVREAIMAEAPQGANVLAISWENGKDKARVTAEGPNARKFLEETLEAKGVVELLSARERKSQKG